MKKTQKLVAIAMCAVFLLTFAPFALATSSLSQPAMQAFSKTSLANSEIAFSPDDFQSDYTLKGIIIASLPDNSCGTLKAGTRELLEGEAVPAAALDTLRFVPSTNRASGTHFTILPVFEEDVPYESVTVNINLLGKENRPPIAADFEITTCKNVSISGMFKGTDPDGDPLTYIITGKPKRGEVELLTDGAFRYTPFENKTGRDSLTYTATDSFGNVSNEAKISIKIEKNASKITYSDMSGNSAHYYALKLAEKGVYVGERVGDSYYFNPGAAMTRGEFLTMLVTALGMTPAETARTGFSDDSDIPEWLKPYVSLALKNGIVSGVSTSDGRKAMEPNREITRAEAAVMLNNASDIANAGVMPVFADSDTVPSWAMQAISNLDAADIFDAYPDGSVRLGESMTREQAAITIYNAVMYKEANDKKGGLFSRAFG